MKLILLVSLAVGLAFGAPQGRDLSECDLDRGNPNRWLSVEIRAQAGSPVPTFGTGASGGRPTGINFCFGSNGAGGYRLQAYSDPSCTVRTENTMRPKQEARQAFLKAVQNDVECGDFDYDAPSCAEFQTRSIARFVAASSSNAEEFVTQFLRATANKDWAVAAIDYSTNGGEGSVVVQQRVYTDTDICSMALTLSNGQQLAFLATVLSPLQLAPSAKASPAISEPEPRLTDCDISSGFWVQAAFSGVERAGLAGQLRFGENFCVSHQPDANQLTYYVRQNLACDVSKESASRQFTMLTTHEIDVIDEDGVCRFDTTFGQCVNDRLRASVIQAIGSLGDIGEIGDRVFSQLSRDVGNSRQWVVFAQEMVDGAFSISRTLRSDPNHCFVIYRTGAGKTFAVMATQTE